MPRVTWRSPRDEDGVDEFVTAMRELILLADHAALLGTPTRRMAKLQAIAAVLGVARQQVERQMQEEFRHG
jgi:hypothetical protein